MLSQLLRVVRLRGAVFYSVQCAAPWVAAAPDASSLAGHLMPGADHVIEYHVVVEGRCWAGLVDGERHLLEAGDIIMLPHGHAHVLSNDPKARPPTDAGDLAARSGRRLPVQLDYGSSARKSAEIVCGFLACDAVPFNPLLAALPPVIVRRRTDEALDAMLASLVASATHEAAAHRPGGDAVLSRLSELMFIEVVRGYLATGVDERSVGWLAGLRDPVVGPALTAMHAQPRREWTLETMARRVGASRTVLAERFRRVIGMPPIQYLAQWRMQLAATMLADTSQPLASIALDVGYGSEAAFNRAFRKVVGVPPAAWRSSRARAEPPTVHP